MPIISVGDNENNIWKRNAKTKQNKKKKHKKSKTENKKGTRGMEALMIFLCV